MITKTTIPDDAAGLQVHRFLPGDQLRSYTAIEFTTPAPAASCRVYYRRCEAFGMVHHDVKTADGICDVLDKDGNIIGDFCLTKRGIRWLNKKLGASVESPNDISIHMGKGGAQ